MNDISPTAVQPLEDQDLADANGGALSVQENGHLYVFSGSNLDEAFMCKRCYSPVRYAGKLGGTELFRCDKCGINFDPKNLYRRQATGLWMKWY